MNTSRSDKKRKTRGFTLIEVLVVVAIIALLIAILLPSLSRAKQMSKMIQCQSNEHQQLRAFLMYAHDHKGRLPGTTNDEFADWLGFTNGPNGTIGKEPEMGTLYKYMGRAKKAYHCPIYGDDVRDTEPEFTFNYCSNYSLSGALIEQLGLSHYPLSDFHNKNHRASPTRRMAAFPGTPILIEEDTVCNLTRTGSRDGGWAYSDAITQRHLRSGSNGYGNLGYQDGHVGRIDLRPSPVPLGDANSFSAWDMCFRIGIKWVNNDGSIYPPYGGLTEMPDASVRGFTH